LKGSTEIHSISNDNETHSCTRTTKIANT